MKCSGEATKWLNTALTQSAECRWCWNSCGPESASRHSATPLGESYLRIPSSSRSPRTREACFDAGIGFGFSIIIEWAAVEATRWNRAHWSERLSFRLDVHADAFDHGERRAVSCVYAFLSVAELRHRLQTDYLQCQWTTFAHSSQLEIHFVEPTVSQNRNGRIVYDFLDLRFFSNIGHATPIFSTVHRYVFEELFKDANIMSLWPLYAGLKKLF